jgi:hypothetical protein
LHLNAIGPALFATVVRVEKKRVVVALASRKEMVLDLRRPNCFDVASLRQIEVTRATRYEASEPERIGKSVPIVRWTASAIFNAPEGGKVDGPQRSSVLRIEIGFKGTISIGLCQFERMAEAKGHKMEMVVKGLHYMGCWSQ